MKQLILTLCLLGGWASAAQTRLPDGTWEDRDLAFLLLDESVRADGALSLCIAQGRPVHPEFDRRLYASGL